MQLIGMLDSPFVRRVAISAQLLGLPFEHRPLSVFRNFEEFRQINPAVKAPTLICEDGTVLMESSLILQYLEARAGRSQLHAAYAALEQIPPPESLDQAGLTTAVAWRFTQFTTPGAIDPDQFPRLAAWSAQAESTNEFRRAACGDGTYPVTDSAPA